jgi:hypothetical protein
MHHIYLHDVKAPKPQRSFAHVYRRNKKFSLILKHILKSNVKYYIFIL